MRTENEYGYTPRWLIDNRLVETIFCDEFLIDHPMKSVNGAFFTINGRVDDENLIRKAIYERIARFVPNGAYKKSGTLLETIRLKCHAPDFSLHEDRVHVANGTYNLYSGFTEEKEYCRNRLTVNYNPDAPKPERWLTFLSELFEEEDIITFQQYMGYLLLPITKCQKMLLIIGKGGEGKSRIGVVLRSIFGNNMNIGSIAKIESNRFARADLENRLLLLDDDMKLEALPETHTIKSIVTAELPMDLEKKGIQSYQGVLYARFIGLGNGTLRSLHDNTEGFFRRQIILTTKDKPEGRVDDPFLAEKLCREKEGIFNWMLEGLESLLLNDLKFTISAGAEENLNSSRNDANNAGLFMESEGYIKYGEDYEISSRDLYEVYRQWCSDNACEPIPPRVMLGYVKENGIKYGLKSSTSIHIGSGRYVRGFKGVDATRGSRFNV